MAKPRKTAASASTPVLSDDDTDATPAPPATLHITPWTLSGKQALHRVHAGQVESALPPPTKNEKAAVVDRRHDAQTVHAEVQKARSIGR